MTIELEGMKHLSKEPENMKTSNVNIVSFESLMTPTQIKKSQPISKVLENSILASRKTIENILVGNDRRLLVIVGPCSIHDTKAGLEYAKKLADLKESVSDKAFIVMRVYFEKPRTTVGWKGLINDPHLDGSKDIRTGLTKAREFLISINELGLPCATEFLDPIVPQYTSDLVSWAAIGARTTESQTHRELASGLSMPVGFKNATDGGLQIALDAMVSAKHPHSFLGVDEDGYTSVVKTAGNKNCHIILRGGASGPNYSSQHISETKKLLEKQGSHPAIMVDCSHGNSNKDFSKQPDVFANLVKQRQDGEDTIVGVMLESFLESGNQKLSSDLVYGKSITDGCIDWKTTENLLKNGLS